MTFWEVEWTEDAEVQMGRILYYSSDRSELMAAAKRIEEALERLPDDAGESREEVDQRIVIEPPLAVYCHVFPERLYVSIYAAWRWGK